MIVCVCHGLSDAELRAELEAGARSADDLARRTGAATDCGCCRGAVEELIRSRAPCASTPCPGCPRAAPAA